VYGGYGCPDSAPIPPADEAVAGVTLEPGEERIVVLQRGPTDDPGASEAACFPGEKAAEAVAAGYEAVVLVNRHLGSEELDEPFCGSGAFPEGDPIPTVCTTHAAFHAIFDTPPAFDLPYQPGTEPEVGDIGGRVTVEGLFDGWGYVHLYSFDAETGAVAEIDQYAVPESLDESFARGFGDLSVHEVAMDRDQEGLAYISYYGAGFRVVEYGPDGITEVGAFVAPEGSNFWGVEYWTSPTTGEDYVLASDRNTGLWVLSYEPEMQPESVTVRISGAGRIETAVEVSRASYETGTAGAVVLARADVFADALAGTPLAIDVDAPILLTDSDTLHPLVESELARVLPETGTPTVYLLGGTVALDQPVEDRLDELGYDTVRYGGLNRFATAAIIADEGLDNPDTLLLANGGDFPDAVSAGAAAGHADGAVLLTSGADMAPETAAYLEAHPVEARTAIGGSAAQADPDATAIVGANRVATAVMVAESFFPSPAVVGLATAGDFADGLTGGAMVGRLGGPILLTDGAALSAEVRTYLEDNTDSIMTAYIYGGVEALSQDVQDEVEDVLTP